MAEIDDIVEYIKQNLPKKYLNAFSLEKINDLLELAYENFYELRSAGGTKDPPDYIGDEPCEDAITIHQLYDELLYILEEMERAVFIIEKAMIRWLNCK